MKLHNSYKISYNIATLLFRSHEDRGTSSSSGLPDVQGLLSKLKHGAKYSIIFQS